MFHGEWRMGDPVSHSGFRFPTQNKLWKVKHKLEELKIAIGKDKKRRSPYKCDYIDPDVKFVSINSLFKRLVDKSFCFIPPPLASFLKKHCCLLNNDQNCSLQFHLRNDNAWPDENSGYMLTSLKIPSIGAAVLLQLPLLVILGHIQQIDVSTNQPETRMTLLM